MVELDALPDFDLTDEHPDPEKSLEAAQDRRQVRKALLQLPDEQRQSLALAYFRGLTQEQIAGVLDVPLGTVKTRLRLGMQKLRKYMESSKG